MRIKHVRDINKKYIKRRFRIKNIIYILLFSFILIYITINHFLYSNRTPIVLFENVNHSQYINVTINNIPKSIVLTAKEAPFSLFKCKCETLNPSFEIIVNSDEEMETFLREKYGDDHLLWSKLNKIERTDFWRYNIIYEYGGIYMDEDIECLVPSNEWTNHLNPYSLPINHHNNVLDTHTSITDINIDVVIGIEWDKITRAYNKHVVAHLNPIGFNQYVFAANSKNPMIQHVITNILKTIMSHNINDKLKSNKKTMWKTGPNIWTKSIIEYINKYYIGDGNVKEFQNVYPEILFDEKRLNQFGQIMKLSYPDDNNKYFWMLILPRHTFDEYAYHHQLGSWKSDFNLGRTIKNMYLKTQNFLLHGC